MARQVGHLAGIPPMLGLMATIIPLGSGLAAPRASACASTAGSTPASTTATRIRAHDGSGYDRVGEVFRDPKTGKLVLIEPAPHKNHLEKPDR